MLLPKVALGLLLGADFVFRHLPASVLVGGASCPAEPDGATEDNETLDRSRAGPVGDIPDLDSAPDRGPGAEGSASWRRLWQRWTEFLGPFLQTDPISPARMGWLRWTAYCLWYGIDLVAGWGLGLY